MFLIFQKFLCAVVWFFLFAVTLPASGSLIDIHTRTLHLPEPLKFVVDTLNPKLALKLHDSYRTYGEALHAIHKVKTEFKGPKAREVTLTRLRAKVQSIEATMIDVFLTILHGQFPSIRCGFLHFLQHSRRYADYSGGTLYFSAVKVDAQRDVCPADFVEQMENHALVIRRNYLDPKPGWSRQEIVSLAGEHVTWMRMVLVGMLVDKERFGNVDWAAVKSVMFSLLASFFYVSLNACRPLPEPVSKEVRVCGTSRVEPFSLKHITLDWIDKLDNHYALPESLKRAARMRNQISFNVVPMVLFAEDVLLNKTSIFAKKFFPLNLVDYENAVDFYRAQDGFLNEWIIVVCRLVDDLIPVDGFGSFPDAISVYMNVGQALHALLFCLYESVVYGKPNVEINQMKAIELARQCEDSQSLLPSINGRLLTRAMFQIMHTSIDRHMVLSRSGKFSVLANRPKSSDLFEYLLEVYLKDIYIHESWEEKLWIARHYMAVLNAYRLIIPPDDMSYEDHVDKCVHILGQCFDGNFDD